MADLFQWHHSTYAAFCRNYGTHSTRNAGSHCWNTELLEGTKADLEESWSSLEDWILTQKRLLNDAVRAAFQKNLECLEGKAHIFNLDISIYNTRDGC